MALRRTQLRNCIAYIPLSSSEVMRKVAAAAGGIFERHWPPGFGYIKCCLEMLHHIQVCCFGQAGQQRDPCFSFSLFYEPDSPERIFLSVELTLLCCNLTVPEQSR